MKRTVHGLAALLLGILLANPPLLQAASPNNPYNSPIRSANPNSRQGSVPSVPPVRGPSTAPIIRQPTLENRGIGNDMRREPSTPATQAPRPQRPPDGRTP
ncbi:hypothetical protein D3C76_211920 [compost metagenome]